MSRLDPRLPAPLRPTTGRAPGPARDLDPRRGSRAMRVRAALVVIGCGLAAAAGSLLLEGAWPRTVDAAAAAGPDAERVDEPGPTERALRRRALAGDSTAELALGQALAERASAPEADPRLLAAAAMWLDRARQHDETAAVDALQVLFERHCWRAGMATHWLCDLGE
jgi:hypothetical protein